MPSIPSSDFDGISVADLIKLADSESDRGRAAARVLGERYANGNYPGLIPKVASDWEYHKIAADWYRKAALIPSRARVSYSPGFGSVPASTTILDSGDPPAAGDNHALVELGWLYWLGNGVPLDRRWAMVLFKCAGDRDHVPVSDKPIK